MKTARAGEQRKQKTASNNPVQVEVRFVPNTGNKRPYEMWLLSGSGRWYHRGSFSTQDAAEKKAIKTRKIFGLGGAR